MSTGRHKRYHWDSQDKFDKLLLGLLLIGDEAYPSHLALDTLTSKSLPLIGKL